MFHLTAKNVVSQRFSRGSLGGAKVALMGFCPWLSALERYASVATPDQYFIHVSPNSVRILSCGSTQVVSLHHIYGGPVASATVEELAYYGIQYILAYGLAGGLGTPACAMGDYYMVKDALAADGTTRHYTQAPIVSASRSLCQRVTLLWQKRHEAPLKAVRAATGDAIYREDDALLQGFRSQQCHIINLDSSHLYAVSQINGESMHIDTVQCGVVSDVIPENSAHAETALSAMLSQTDQTSFNPMQRVNDIVTFYLDIVVPNLMNNPL